MNEWNVICRSRTVEAAIYSLSLNIRLHKTITLQRHNKIRCFIVEKFFNMSSIRGITLIELLKHSKT